MKDMIKYTKRKKKRSVFKETDFYYFHLIEIFVIIFYHKIIDTEFFFNDQRKGIMAREKCYV